MKIAVKSLGLDDLGPFDPNSGSLNSYRCRPKHAVARLVLGRVRHRNRVRKSGAGQWVGAAYSATMGVALATMVANLSAHKRGWDDRWEEFSRVAGETLLAKPARAARRCRHGGVQCHHGSTACPRALNTTTIASCGHSDATKNAIEIPMQVALTRLTMTITEEMAATGNPNSITDAGVGGMTIRTGVKGAILNARVSLQDLEDATYECGGGC